MRNRKIQAIITQLPDTRQFKFTANARVPENEVPPRGYTHGGKNKENTPRWRHPLDASGRSLEPRPFRNATLSLSLRSIDYLYSRLVLVRVLMEKLWFCDQYAFGSRACSSAAGARVVCLDKWSDVSRSGGIFSRRTGGPPPLPPAPHW